MGSGCDRACAAGWRKRGCSGERCAHGVRKGRGHDERGWKGANFQGNSLRGSAGWRAAMEGPATRGKVERRAKSDGVWRALHAMECVWGHGVSRRGAERELPVLERVDARSFKESETASNGVDLRRGIPGGSDVRAAAGWRAFGGRGRGGREHELPAGSFWLFLASGVDQGIGASSVG